MSYKELLKRPEWKEKRQIIIKRDGYKCKLCSATKNLQVHHKKYIENRMPWHYANKHLVTLCATCHKSEHVLDDDKFANNIEAVTSDPDLLHKEMRHRLHSAPDTYKPMKKKDGQPWIVAAMIGDRTRPSRVINNSARPLKRNLDSFGGFKKKITKPKKYKKQKFETLTWGVD